MKVLPKTLLLLAGIVWFIAGGNYRSDKDPGGPFLSAWRDFNGK